MKRLAVVQALLLIAALTFSAHARGKTEQQEVKSAPRVLNWIAPGEVSTGVALYEAGKLDGTTVAGEYLSLYRGTPDLVSVKTLRMTNLELGISSNEYLQNLNLRKALLLAVDRNELAQSVLNGDVIPNGIAVNPVNGKSIAEDFGNLVSTNVPDARRYFDQALQELGVSSIKLRLVTTDNDEGSKTGQYLQSVYETSLPGLKIDLANVPASVRFQEMMAYKFDLALGGWTGEFNPATYIKQFETSNEHNHGKWVSSEITAQRLCGSRLGYAD